MPPGARTPPPAAPQATQATELAPATQGNDQPVAEQAAIAPEATQATQLAASTQASEQPLWSQDADDAGGHAGGPAAEPAAGADDETPM